MFVVSDGLSSLIMILTSLSIYYIILHHLLINIILLHCKYQLFECAVQIHHVSFGPGIDNGIDFLFVLFSRAIKHLLKA